MKKILLLIAIMSLFTSCEQNELEDLEPVQQQEQPTEPIISMNDSIYYMTNYRDKYIGIWKHLLEIANNNGDGTKIIKHQSYENKIILQDFYDEYLESNSVDLILEITPYWYDSLNHYDQIYIPDQTFILWWNQPYTLTISGSGGYFPPITTLGSIDTTFVLNMYLDYGGPFVPGFNDGQRQFFFKKIE